MARMLVVDGWNCGLRFSACHMIPGHDKCGRMHGHTYAVHVRIKGVPNDQHIIADFSKVKSAIRLLCSELDHKMLLPKDNPHIKVQGDGQNVRVTMGDKVYSFPGEDVLVLDIPSATAEAFARYILDSISEDLREDNIEEIEVGIDEGLGQGAWARDRFRE